MRYFYLVVTIVVAVFAITTLTTDEPSIYTESPDEAVQTIGAVQTLVTVKPEQVSASSGTIEFLLQGEQQQSMRELQKQYDDYYTLALELLHRARAGDGVSQLNLAGLLLHCQQVVLIDVDDEISILLATEVSKAEADMLEQLKSEVAKCANFQNIDYKFFEDINYDNEQVLERSLYWITKSFRNGVTDAAAYLISLHLSEVIKLSDDERLLAAKMVREELARPSLATLTYLAHLSSTPHSFRVVAALKQEPGFFRESDELQFSTAEIGIIPCLERSVLWAEPVTPRYDCAENISRYGVWIEPELIPEVEAEVEKVKQAWEKGDYAAAGFEALMPLLNDTHQP
ncbi:hypothetical protein ORJ00_14145 [Rheinheimera baltica]|uniref:hypothetical protein n=1 Tax=Rheinheimera baltica TaxID=67576 RepID=UPI00273D1EA1|nr:hypothetical protein [Rheinheimera baltica]MDP5143891.1 hypothetical protein [Rheinheimera baltica]